MAAIFENEVARKSELEWTNVWPVAIRALGKNLLVEDHRISFDQSRLFVTQVASNLGVPALKRKMCPRVVIEGGGHPTLRTVAIRARSLTSLCKLARVSVLVTIPTNLRSSLELHLVSAHGRLVAGAALDHAVCAEKRELRFRMVKTVYIDPGPHVVAGFASQRCAVGASLRHAILEFAVMRILVAAGTTAIFEAERHNFVGAACRSHLVTIGAPNGGVGSGQSETSVAMLGDGIERTVKIAHGMAILAFVQMRRRGELAVMSVFMAVRAKREFHLVNGVLAGRKMALGAFHGNVFAS